MWLSSSFQRVGLSTNLGPRDLAMEGKRLKAGEALPQAPLGASPAPRTAELLFLVVVSFLAGGNFPSRTGKSSLFCGLLGKKQGSFPDLAIRKGNLEAHHLSQPPDGHCFSLGLSCLLRRLPMAVAEATVAYVAQYIRSFSEAGG